jgi:aminotransferase in exopolysaccharide biosynthesis
MKSFDLLSTIVFFARYRKKLFLRKKNVQSHSFDIPLASPHLAGNEWKYIQDCLETNWITSVGKYIPLFEDKVAEYTQSKYAVAVSSGTAALHLALLAVGVERNDVVLLPNLSFVASVNAIHYCGAEPLLVDVTQDTWQLDATLLENFLEKECTVEENNCFVKSSKKRIKAILPVHILGNVGEMQKILTLAQKYHLAVVEDAAESLGSFYKNTHTGCLSDVGIISFNGNKVVTTGGGGMILTQNEKIAQKVRHWANQSKADSHEYYHDEVGYNYRLINLLAAIGLAQMEQLEHFLQQKEYIHTFYQQKLSEKLIFQKILNDVKPNYWLTTVLSSRSKNIQESLEKKGVQTRKLWYPLNRLPMYQNATYVTENDYTWQIYEQSVSLPSGVGLKEEHLKKIVETILEAVK